MTGSRLVSLDAFRGLTIAGMILVNNPGSWSHVYAPLRHAEWHGWTPTDLVFPSFLFIVGVSIVLAFDRRLEQGVARRAIAGKALRRALVLFALGLFLSGFPRFELSTLRVPGVLQRIAVCYLAASLLYLHGRPRRLPLVCAGLLLGYWALMTLVPVPGYGAGRIDEPAAHLSAWLDRLLLGQDHLWRSSRVYDPEGVLSTLPAVATCLFGVFAGRVLQGEAPAAEKTVRLFVRGSLLVVLGYAWGWVFPINKSIWTSSYAVFTAGQATCGLALCYWLADVRGHRRWAAPFVTYGLNAITVFVMSGVLGRILARTGAKAWVHDTCFAGWLPPKVASLAYALCWVLGWYAVLRAMQRRGIVLKV